jgi:hypothetical protein
MKILSKTIFLSLSIITLTLLFKCSSNNKFSHHNECTKDSLDVIKIEQATGQWQKGVFYESENAQLYQLRIYSHYKNQLLIPSFYYLSYNHTNLGKYAYIHELNACKEDYIIDSLYIHNTDGDELIHFFNRQFDNLLRDDNKLYYYKELNVTNENNRNQKENRKYFKYTIDSKLPVSEAKTIPDEVKNARISFNSFERYGTPFNKKKSAYSNGYDIEISDVRYGDLEDLYEKGNVQPLRVDIIKNVSLKGLMGYKDDAAVAFGDFCWKTENNFYFILDNKSQSGLYWYNPTTFTVNTIALGKGFKHLYAFNKKNKSYVAYTQENKIILNFCDQDILHENDRKGQTDIQKPKYSLIQQNDDDFWQRGIIYEMPHKEEHLFNPQCIEYNDALRYYFLGATQISKHNDLSTVKIKLYEYLPNNEHLSVIDSSICRYYWHEDTYYNKMDAMLQWHENKLYYRFEPFGFKEISCNTSKEQVSDSLFFKSYSLTSRQIKDSIRYADIYPFFTKLPGGFAISKTNKIALRDDRVENVYVFTDQSKNAPLKTGSLIDSISRSWVKSNNENNFLYNNFEHEGSDTILTILDSNNIAYEFSFNGLETAYSDQIGSFIVGYLSWDYSGKNLFFCNSNIEIACIWQVDVDDRTVEKIVPEHDAIHPFYFEYKGRPYVLYVENNKLMICEPPNKN